MLKIVNISVIAEKITITFNSSMNVSIVPTPSHFELNVSSPITQIYWYTNTLLVLELQDSLKQEDKLIVGYTRQDNNNVESSKGIQLYDFDFLEALNFTSNQEEVTSDRNLDEDYPVPGVPYEATVNDFIAIYGKREAIQLTNLDHPNRTTVDTGKIRMALDDANALIENYVSSAGLAGKRLISSNKRRTACILARYYLDSVRRRKDVLEDYERAIKELDANAEKSGGFRDEEELAINNRGLLRVIQKPQIYNDVNGKGFEGWPKKMEDYNYPTEDRRRYGNTRQLSPKRRRSSRQRPQDGGGVDNQP